MTKPKSKQIVGGEERINIGGGDIMVFDSTASTYHVGGTPMKKSAMGQPSHHDDHEISASSTAVASTANLYPVPDFNPHPDSYFALPTTTPTHPVEHHVEVVEQPAEEVVEAPAAPAVAEEEEPPGNHSIITRSLCEFLATFLFVYVGVMQQGSWYPAHKVGNESMINETDLDLLNSHVRLIPDGVLHSAITHGFAVFVLASAFAGISGGLVNPAITLGMAISGKLDIVSAACYIPCQLVGAFAGAGMTRGVLIYSNVENIGATLVSVDYQFYHALVGEAVCTFILVIVVLMSGPDQESPLAALASGVAVTVGILALGNISGGSLNPARSLGPQCIGAIVIGNDELPDRYWIDHWIYHVGPLMGGALAGGIFRVVLSKTRILLP